MENLKELYNLSKEIFASELDRFYSLEQKASQYLTVLTLLLAAAGFFLNWLFENFLPPRNHLDVGLLIVAIATVISLIVAWFAVFSSLKVYKVNIIPLNSRWIEMFKDSDMNALYYHVSVRLKEGREENRTTLNKKGRWLQFGFNSMRLAVVFLILFASLFAVYKWREPKPQTEGAIYNVTK